MKLIRAYASIAAIPISQITPPKDTATCIGFTLDATSGEKEFDKTGFTVLSMILTPDSICGSLTISIFSGITFPLGRRLSALSKETGQRSRTATNPQSRQDIHFGDLFRNIRAAITAIISQDAFIARLRILRNKAFIAFIPP